MPSLKCVELYGVDWEGPTPSNDEHAVNVDELPMLLTSDQKADLDIEISHLPSITGVNMQECLIAHYMAAKLFIRTVHHAYTEFCIYCSP